MVFSTREHTHTKKKKKQESSFLRPDLCAELMTFSHHQQQSTSRCPAPCAISLSPAWHPPGWSLKLCHIFIIPNADEAVERLFCTSILAEMISEPCLFSRWQLSICTTLPPPKPQNAKCMIYALLSLQSPISSLLSFTCAPTLPPDH